MIAAGRAGRSRPTRRAVPGASLRCATTSRRGSATASPCQPRMRTWASPRRPGHTVGDGRCSQHRRRALTSASADPRVTSRCSPAMAAQQPCLGLPLGRSWSAGVASTALRSSGFSSRRAACGAASRSAPTRSRGRGVELARRHGDAGQPDGARPRPPARTARSRRSPAPGRSRPAAPAAPVPARSGTSPRLVSRMANCDVVGHHPQVARQGQLEPGADRVALHGGDDHGRHLATSRRTRAGSRRSRVRRPPRHGGRHAP